MQTAEDYSEDIESFVDDVVDWRADASSISNEFGADVVSLTAVNFLGHTLDFLEAADQLLEADSEDEGLSQGIEEVIHDYNDARFSQMTTWYEHRTAVRNMECDVDNFRGEFYSFAEGIQENIWDAMDITRKVQDEVKETNYAERIDQHYDDLREENSDTLEFIDSIEEAYEDDVSFQRGLELVEEEGNPVR